MYNNNNFGFKKSRKRAFSLIELSVVLIIIGLLIAGVTGGASLIKNAELRSIIGEARGYQSSVNSFYAQFGNYPGTFDQVIGTSLAGDGDREISWYKTTPATVSEAQNAWLHLTKSKVLSEDIISTSNAGILTTVMSPETSFPASKKKLTGWIFSYVDVDGVTGGTKLNSIILTKSMTGVASTVSDVAPQDKIADPLTTADAYSLDKKMDDGDPLKGTVYAAEVTATAGAAACISVAKTYNTAVTSDDLCTIAISVQMD